jgi:hypothetical protein
MWHAILADLFKWITFFAQEKHSMKEQGSGLTQGKLFLTGKSS